jgi:hypothetical protein
MKRWIDRALGQIENTIAFGAERFEHGISVPRLRLDSRENQQIQVPFERFASHT